MALDPKIVAELDRLIEKADVLTQETASEVDLLQKTLQLKTDYMGVKLRTQGLSQKVDQLLWIAAEIEALRKVAWIPETLTLEY